MRWSLNAPCGARCFLTARRVAPPVTRDNVVSDRQWPKKRPSGQQARGQNIRLFIATARIAATACGADAVPEIAATVGVSLLHNASHL